MSSLPRPISSSFSSSSSSFLCPLTRGILKEPVKDLHGHIFEKNVIEEWLKVDTCCPINRKTIQITDLKPNPELQQSIEALKVSPVLDDGIDLPPGSVPQPLGVQDDDMANTYIRSALELEAKDKLLDAEQMYVTALQYTCKSSDYAHLPSLFEKKKESKRAAFTYVYLATLQIQEGLKQEGVKSVQKALQLVSSPQMKYRCSFFLKEKGLHQEASQSFLDLTFQAHYNGDSQNALLICREALACFRGNVEVWKLLACLQPDSTQGNKILLEGAREPLLALKARKALCQWVLMKDSEHVPANLLLLSLKVEKLRNDKRELEKKQAEDIRALREEMNKSLESETIQRWVGALWGAQHMTAAEKLFQIGAPAIPFLVQALKGAGDNIGQFSFGNSYHHTNNVWIGVDSILYTLKGMAKNNKALPDLKKAIQALIGEIRGGLRLATMIGISDTNRSILAFGVTLGLISQ